jgi:hypothetical protein
MWMNAMEIDEAHDRFKNHPILGPATQFLWNFKNVVNENTDGWCYWEATGTSAQKLMDLINDAKYSGASDGGIPTEEQINKAMIPIKSLCTKHKFTLPPIFKPGQFSRNQINCILSNRIEALDDSEVAKLFSFLFNTKLNTVTPGVFTYSQG